jgi:hypothetical protein
VPELDTLTGDGLDDTDGDGEAPCRLDGLPIPVYLISVALAPWGSAPYQMMKSRNRRSPMIESAIHACHAVFSWRLNLLRPVRPALRPSSAPAHQQGKNSQPTQKRMR